MLTDVELLDAYSRAVIGAVERVGPADVVAHRAAVGRDQRDVLGDVDHRPAADRDDTIAAGIAIGRGPGVGIREHRVGRDAIEHRALRWQAIEHALQHPRGTQAGVADDQRAAHVQRRQFLRQPVHGTDGEHRTRQFEHGIREFGNALKELAGGNVFPGDLLPKNFGVTRYGRVVFYDYDEICPLTSCNFRWLPKASSDDDEMAGEPWFSIGPHDVFPEQFERFVQCDPQRLHGEVIGVDGGAQQIAMLEDEGAVALELRFVAVVDRNEATIGAQPLGE